MRSNAQLVAEAEHALFDAVNGIQEIALLAGHGAGVNAAAFSPDGQRAATASDDRSVRLWDLKTEKQLATITGHAGAVASVAFSPDGQKLVTASTDGTARIWDVETRKELA